MLLNVQINTLKKKVIFYIFFTGYTVIDVKSSKTMPFCEFHVRKKKKNIVEFHMCH